MDYKTAIIKLLDTFDQKRLKVIYEFVLHLIK